MLEFCEYKNIKNNIWLVTYFQSIEQTEIDEDTQRNGSQHKNISVIVIQLNIDITCCRQSFQIRASKPFQNALYSSSQLHKKGSLTFWCGCMKVVFVHKCYIRNIRSFPILTQWIVIYLEEGLSCRITWF